VATTIPAPAVLPTTATSPCLIRLPEGTFQCSYKTVLCYSSRRRLPSLGADKRQAGITATSARSVPTANVTAKTSCTHSRVFQLNMVPSISRSWHHIGHLPNSGAVTAVTGFAIGMNAPHRCDSRHSSECNQHSDRINRFSPTEARMAETARHWSCIRADNSGRICR
jgi:hypothetical protein